MIQIYVSHYPKSELIKVHVKPYLKTERLIKEVHKGWEHWTDFDDLDLEPNWGTPMIITQEDKAWVTKIFRKAPF